MKQVLIVGNYEFSEHNSLGLVSYCCENDLKKEGFEIIEVCDLNNFPEKIYQNKSIVAVFLNFLSQ